MANRIDGKVVQVTDEGDLVSDIAFEQLENIPRDSSVQITVDDEHETFGIFPPEHGQPTMTLIAILDDQQNLRLHLVGDSASMMLGVRQGAAVRVAW